MKIKQINKQIIDWYESRKKGKAKLAGFKHGGKTYITDGFVCYILKDEDCYIEFKDLGKSEFLLNMAKALGEDELVSTNEMIKKEGILINLYVYQDDKDTIVGIDSKFLKYFENYTLKSIKGKDDIPVGIFEKDELVGFVMPVRLADKDD